MRRPRSSTPSHRSRPPSETPIAVPLWREAIRVEAELRPQVTIAAARRADPFPYIAVATSVALVSAVSVGGSIVLYRGELVRARAARPPKLQGAPIVPLRQLIRPEIAEVAWREAASAFGCGLALWLALFAVPRWRRVVLRWAALPALAGACGWLYFQWWYARQL